MAFNVSFANNLSTIVNPPIASRPPPPDDGSCKGGPGKDTKTACTSFQWKLNRYLREEGDKNRGLRFYEAILEYTTKNKTNNYQLKITNILKYFGSPDYKRNSESKGEQLKEFAYLFDYHANKDWVCIISFNDYGIKSVSYGKTVGIAFGGWLEYE